MKDQREFGPSARVALRCNFSLVNSEFVAGVVGAAVGAIFTAGATWFVSTRLDRLREYRQLIGALEIVRAELEENKTRIATAQRTTGSADNAKGDLTLSDWDKNKGAAAGLTLRNNQLWEELLRVHGEIYEANSSRGDVPSLERIDTVVNQLNQEGERLHGQIHPLARMVRFVARRWARESGRSEPPNGSASS